MYRTGELTIDGFEKHERLALGSLMQLVLLHGDGVGDAANETLQALADDLGQGLFWQILDEAREEVVGSGEAHALAGKVIRKPARELIFAVVSELAMAGSITQNEMAIIDELRRLWDIHEERRR